MTDRVDGAFSLGWHVAELYHVQRLPGEAEPGRADSLPGIGRLPRGDRVQLLGMQIEVEMERLAAHGPLMADAGLPKQLDGAEVPALKAAARSLHDALLKGLTAREARLGKAYGLGRALAETMLIPSTDDPASFSSQFNSYRISTLQADLDDLERSLPPYSADAVSWTLERWSQWAAAANLESAGAQWTPDQKRQVGQSIRRQGQVWYGLLTGEIDPLQLLEPRDYVAATESLLAYIGRLAWSFLVSNWIGRVLGLVALAVTIFLVAVSIMGRFPAVVGAAVLLLGALGVTGGSIASSVGRVLRQAQGPLWDAELANGVAAEALHLPDQLGSVRSR